MHENQASELNVFDNWFLAHEALPDLDFESIMINTQRFKREVSILFL